MNKPDYDVVILGAGLAGGLLARQLRLHRPNLRVLCCERSNTTSYKVGEATVELFSNYLLRKHGLSTYLYEHQLPKNGLRFYFDDETCSTPFEQMSEIGSLSLPYHPSFQIDRSTLERHLRDDSRRLGAEVIEGAKVTGVTLGEPHHRVEFSDGPVARAVTTTWVVDASGRTSILAKQLGLRVPADHKCLAAWGRVVDAVDVDGPDIDLAFRNRIRNTSRRLSTIHFMHRGYWVWLIPLRGGVTSVGVVGDARHLGRDALSLPGLRQRIEGQRAVRDLLAPARWLDFGGYGQLAYGTRQWFGDRWALIGEAAAFSDPFYSPGSDFITLANDCATDLIGRHADGEDIAARQRLYDGYLQFRYQANLPLYRDQYELFGSFELIRIKWSFDIACYYDLWLNSYLQDQHLDTDALRHELRQSTFVVRALEHFADLFAATERAVTARGDYNRRNRGEFVEGLAGVDFVQDVGNLSRQQAERIALATFATARDRCFELLGRPARSGQTPSFADFVTGSALVAANAS